VLNGGDFTITVTGVSDPLGNAIAGSNSGTGTGYGVAPSVVSVARQTPSGQNTNASSVTWLVTFSEAIDPATVNTTGDFMVIVQSGSISGASVAGVAATGDPTAFTVTVGTGSGDGELRLDVVASADIADSAGNVYNVNYSAGPTYIIDKTHPTVMSITRDTPSAQETNAATIVWRVVFNEPVSDVDPADGAVVASLPSIDVTFSKAVTGVAAADLAVNDSQATTITTTDNLTYTFTGYAAVADGGVSVTLASGSILDSVGNAFAGAAWTYTQDSSLVGVILTATGVADDGTTNGSPVSGMGTLAPQPDSVALQSGHTYRLTWTGGEMKSGGAITITAGGAQMGLAGNAGRIGFGH
jgi:hypothetical protein